MWINSIMLKLTQWCVVGLLINMAIGSIDDSEAMLFEGELMSGSTKLQYLRIIHTENTYLLIGARGYLYNVSTWTMDVTQRFEWVSTQEENDYCNNEIAKFLECDSYVRSALKKSDSLFYICASSSKKAACRSLTYTQQEGWVLQPGRSETQEVSWAPPIAPIFPWNEFRMLKTKDTNTLYAAGHFFLPSGTWHHLLYRAEATVGDGGLIPSLRSDYSDAMFKVDYRVEKPVEYGGIFETSNYVFLTFLEPAAETFNSIGSQPASYSRIARVCKNDLGRGEGEGPSTILFATLFKTRMLCGSLSTSNPSSQKFLTEKYVGHYSSYVDELADSTEPHISSVTGADGEEIILAIFNSPRNSMKSAAICAYKVSDLNAVFDNSPQVEFLAGNVPSLRNPERPAARCFNDSRQMSDGDRETAKHYLLYNPVRSINNDSLFMSNVDFRMTHLVVDWQVEALNKKKYDVIFVSTEDGRVIKLVKYLKAEGSEEKYHIVEEREIFPGRAIQEMKLIEDDWGKKHILVNSFRKVKRISLEKCHFHSTCSECVALRDPYCAWSPSLEKCVSTTHEVDDKNQSIETGKSAVCIEKPTDVVVVDVGEEVSTKSYAEEKPKPQTGDKGNVGTSTQDDGGNSSALIPLLATLPIIFAVVGFAVGYLLSRRKYMSPTPHLDHELTKQCKDGTIVNKCDTYQSLPHQRSIQLTNNLTTGKSQNVDIPVGEMTLTRQKQVYV